MANERLQLVLETQTRGEAAIKVLEDLLNRVSATAERSASRQNTAVASQERQLRSFSDSIKGAFSQPLQTATQNLDTFLGGLGRTGVIAGAAVAALTAVTGSAFALVKSTGDAAEGLLNLSDRTGINVNQLDKLQAMAKIAGVSIESISSSSRLLAASLDDTSGGSDKARSALDRLGITLTDTTGAQRDLGQITVELFEKLGQIPSATERIALATATLGRGAQELQPLLRQFKELDETVKALGFGTRETFLRDMAAAGDKIDILGLKWELLKGKLAVPAKAVVDIVFDIASGIGATKLPPVFAKPTEIGRGPVDPDPFGIGKLSLERQKITSRELAFGLFLNDIEDRTRGAEALRGFTAGRAGTESVLMRRADTLKKEIEEIEKVLTSGTLGGKAFGEKQAEFRRKETELGGVEAQRESITRTAAARKKAIDEQIAAINAETKASNDLTKLKLEGGRKLFEQGIEAPQIATRDIETQVLQRQLFPLPGQLDPKVLLELRERNLDIIRETTDFETRRIQLIAGPGGEIQAIEQSTAARLAGLEQLKAAGLDRFEAEREQIEILRDRDLQRLSEIKRQQQEVREASGRVFDALIAGGAGVRGLISGFGLTTGRTIFQNVSELTLGRSSGRFSLPGTGTAEAPSVLGRILSGTPFGPKIDPLKQATEANTLATQANTAALLAISGAAAGVVSLPVGLGGATRALGGLFGGGGIFSGSNRTNPFVFHAAGGAGVVGDIPGGPPSASQLGVFDPRTGAILNPRSNSRLSTGIGAAGIIAGSAFGIRAGVQQSGPQGNLTAIGAAAGGVGGLAALGLFGAAAATGPLAPVLLGIGLAAGVVAGFLGDPKQRRERQITEQLERARFIEPEATEESFDTSGRRVSYGAGGAARSMTVNIYADFIDPKGLIDRSRDIGSALQTALSDGHPVGALILNAPA